MDLKLLFLINREWTHPLLDWVMVAVTSFDLWLVPMILLIVAIGIKGGFRARAFVLSAALIVGILDGLVAKPLKGWVDRPRPYQSHNEVRRVALSKGSPRVLALFRPLKIEFSRSSLTDVEGRSFPSSHTMNTVAVALVCTAFYRRRGAWAFLPALLVGYSRIYTGSHWPSDVLTSVFLSLGLGLLLLAGLEKVWCRLAPRYFPQLPANPLFSA